MKSLRTKILLYLSLVLLLSSVPQIAHADLSGIASVTGSAIFGTINMALDFLIKFVMNAIDGLARILQGVIYFKLSTGGSPVYTVWKLMQSFANMGFIIALILMSFGTIFDTFKLPFVSSYSIYQPHVISGFLIATLLLNFSLAIGQVVTETSNHVSSILLNTLKFDNIGEHISGSLHIAQIGLEATAPRPIAVIDNVPTEGLAQFQKTALSKFPASARAVYDTCAKTEPDLLTCYKRANKAATEANLKQSQGAAPPTGIWPNLVFSSTATWEYLTGGDYAETVMNATPINQWTASSTTPLSVEKVYRLLLLVVLLLSFLVVVAFMLVRIPFIWILLAISPLAWASQAFPGSTLFRDWWKQFWAWQIFSPLYILVIGLGMFAINNITGMVLSMDASGTSMLPAFFATTLAYFLVGFIFVGGSAAVFKMSQMGGTYAGTALGNINSSLGVGGTAGAFAPAARLTGLTTAYDSLKATAVARGQKLKQVGKNITDRSPAAQAFRFKSYDEKLALARKRAGVAGGAKEYTELKGKQVTAEQDNLKKMLPLQNFKEYTGSDGKPVTVKSQENAYLIKRSRDANRNVALAAREELLSRGELQKNPEGLEETKKMYAKIGGEKGFQDRIRRAPGAAALEKKKESDARRDDIIATISDQKFEKVDDVEKVLAPYDEKDADGKKRKSEADYRAAITAISNKAPAQLFEHLKNQNPTLSERAIRLQAFSSVFKDMKKIGELDSKYLEQGTPEYLELRKAIDDRWPTASQKGKDRDGKNRARQAAINANTEKTIEIETLFS